MTIRPHARFRLGRNEATAEATGGASATGLDPIPEIRRVAREHAPEHGYGDTAYNSGEGTVFWVSADWTTNDERDAAYDAFMEIDGVNGVTGDAETALPTGEGWETVWPVPESEEAYERVLSLANRPLGLSFAATVPARVHYRAATVPGQSCATCSAYDDGRCTMFPGNPPVEGDMVCDEWDPANA